MAEIEERIKLGILNAETEATLRGEHLEKTQLTDIIDKYGTLQEDGDTIITKEDEFELSLNNIWYGVLSDSGSYTDKVEQIEILEGKLETLQKQYNELEELNSGNSEVLKQLNEQIETLENEKAVIEASLAEEQAKIADLTTKLEQAEAKLPTLQKDYNNLNTEYTNFKKAIAEAITNQGVTTANDATKETMATNIATLAINKYNAGYSAGTSASSIQSSNVIIGNSINCNVGDIIVIAFTARTNRSASYIDISGLSNISQQTLYSGDWGASGTNYTCTSIMYKGVATSSRVTASLRGDGVTGLIGFTRIY